MAILVDEEQRENEGDLVVAADAITPDIVNFMARFGRGLVCMPITEERARQLGLAPMTPVNRSLHGTNFTVSIEAAEGVTTGISAADRAHTIRVACAPGARPKTSSSRATSSPWSRRPAGSRPAPVTPRRAATWRGSPDSHPPRFCARS